MNNTDLLSFLTEQNLVLVNKDALEEFTINARLSSQVDNRVKWIDRKTAIAKYRVTVYWLREAENALGSCLKFSRGKGTTGTKKYLESSIIKEQNRQAEC
jgi:hypothetical protein